MFRFFNIFGPRQDPSSPYSGVISIFTERAQKGLPIAVFGDGEQTRDFLYVAALVEVLVQALESHGAVEGAVTVGLHQDRKSVGLGKRVSVRVGIGGGRINQKK